jgi:hypothetical protein
MLWVRLTTVTRKDDADHQNKVSQRGDEVVEKMDALDSCQGAWKIRNLDNPREGGILSLWNNEAHAKKPPVHPPLDPPGNLHDHATAGPVTVVYQVV